MKISIIIPCYNESKTVTTLLKRVIKSVEDNYEIIVVNDASDDGTTEILANFLASKSNTENIKIISHKVNQGKGASIRTGLFHASGNIIIIQDADLEYDPNEIRKLILPIKNGTADIVFGSRFKGGELHRVHLFWHRVANWLLTMLSNMFTNLNLSDMECCYKAFRSEIIKSITLRENRFGFEPEITAKVSKGNYRIYEVGISYYGRSYSEGKKIGLKDGLRAIYCIIIYSRLFK